MVSFNCKNVKSSMHDIQQLCRKNDIVFLQETWLATDELYLLNTIDDEFYGRGVSAMDTSCSIMKGRPHGGVAILWRKSLQNIKLHDMSDSRLMCIELSNNNRSYFLINVYMPVDCNENVAQFTSCLSSVNAVSQEQSSPYVCMFGDLNANILSNTSLFKNELQNFCQSEHLVNSTELLCSPDTFTFFSNAHNSVSWLDHLICTPCFHNHVNAVSVDYNILSSDHFPVTVEFNIEHLSGKNQTTTDRQTRNVITWSDVTKEKLCKYNNDTEFELGKVKLSHSLLLCDNLECSDPSHISDISRMQREITEALVISAEPLVRNKNKNNDFKPVAGWNEFCSELHHSARESFLLWVSNGKPRSGVLLDNMCRSRAHFKLALRQCKISSEQVKRDNLAKQLLSKPSKKFWKEISRINGKNSNPVATSIDNVSGDVNIADKWRQHYETLLNSSSNVTLKESVLTKLSECMSFDKRISVSEVIEGVKLTKSGKTCGPDSLYAEHFKHANEKLYILLCLFFNSMLIHNYAPPEFMSTILVPIIKNKKGDLEDINNYRPIALTNVISKIFEGVLLSRLSVNLKTCDNQFGFKKSHSPDMCIFLLKQIIDLYINDLSPVYICFMDSSKAFDRLNFWVLFDKLINRNVPIIFVRFLKMWYCTQELSIRWNDCISKSFNVSNGVRQGGILSPLLFSIYMDSLSDKLNSSKAGCLINDKLYNHLIYADDTVLIAPSAAALQCLLAICDVYSSASDIKYNSKKSVCMVSKPRSFNFTISPNFVLNGKQLAFVDHYNYLGYLFYSNSKDNEEISKNTRSMYIRGNSLVRNFKHCSEDVKCELFRAYCTSFYCSSLWCNFTDHCMRRLNVSYKGIFRNLFKLERDCSISGKMTCFKIDTLPVLLRKNVYNFRKRLYLSKNDLIINIVSCVSFNFCTLVAAWNKMLYL